MQLNFIKKLQEMIIALWCTRVERHSLMFYISAFSEKQRYYPKVHLKIPYPNIIYGFMSHWQLICLHL